MISSSKLPWVIGLVASLIYFALFDAIANGKATYGDSLLFGFCVWGYPNIPNEEHGCYNDMKNSHMLGFAVDVFLTIFVFMLWTKDKSPPKQTLMHLAIGFVILSHGLLHLFLFLGLDCFIDVADIPPKMTQIGYTLFSIFTFVLSLTILGFAFADNLKEVLLGSAAFTGSVVWITWDTGSEWLLTALFAMSHPLSCFAGLFTSSPAYSEAQGWAFVVSTLVGILEVTTCSPFYRGVGGHMWYDVTLGIAMVLGLPSLASDDKIKKN